MTTENLAKFQEIANRGLQDKLDPDKRARFDEALRRGLIQSKVSRETKPLELSSTNQAIRDAGVPEGALSGFTPIEKKEKPQFPDDPSTTRAAQELPELFSSGLLAGENQAKIAQFATLASVTTNPEEIAKIATNLFPSIGVQQDSGGNFVLANNKTGVRAIINRPGISVTDVAQFAGLATAFTPAGAARNLGARELAKLAGRSAATQGVIEAGQVASGGEFNPEEVALSGLTAPAGQAATEKLLSPLIRATKGQIPLKAQQIISAGEDTGIPVLTSDIRNPESINAGLFRQFAERVPFLGTGGMRGAQNKAREDFVKAFAESVPPVNDKAIMQSLINKKDTIKAAAGERYQRIIAQMDSLGEIPTTNTVKQMDSVINELKDPRRVTDSKAIEDLVKIKEALSKGQNFSSLKGNRTDISDIINNFDNAERSQTFSRTKSLLVSVRDAMTKDMDEFLQKSDTVDFNKYKQADRIYSEEFKLLSKSRLKNVLDKGDITPEQYRNLMFSSKPSEQRILYDSLGNDGRANARIAILDEIIKKSGGVDDITPAKFTRELRKNSSQIDIFFKGREKQQLQGLERLLVATRHAENAKGVTNTGQVLQQGALVGLTAGSVIGNPIAQLAAVFSGTAALGAKVYESAPVRNALLKLANTKRGSRAEREALDEILPIINATIQATRQEQ